VGGHTTLRILGRAHYGIRHFASRHDRSVLCRDLTDAFNRSQRRSAGHGDPDRPIAQC
jgi:hypothetical protein